MNQELVVVMNTLIGEMGKMEVRINDRMDKRFEAIEKRLDQHDKRFEAIEKRLDRHDKRFDQSNQRMNRMEKDMKTYVNVLVDEMGKMEARMDKRFQKIDERFDRMDKRLDSMQHEIDGCKLACETVSLLIQKVDQHESRIQRLEKKMA